MTPPATVSHFVPRHRTVGASVSTLCKKQVGHSKKYAQVSKATTGARLGVVGLGAGVFLLRSGGDCSELPSCSVAPGSGAFWAEVM